MIRRIALGVFAAIGVLTLLLAAGGAIAASLLLPRAPILPDRIVLTLDLREGVDEAPAQEPLDLLGLTTRPTFTGVIMALDQAGRDSRVKGLVAQLSGEGPGFAQSQELRAAVTRFRSQGKFAYAYADSFGEFGPGTRGYYL